MADDFQRDDTNDECFGFGFWAYIYREEQLGALASYGGSCVIPTSLDYRKIYDNAK